jgi:hypothetical protein
LSLRGVVSLSLMFHGGVGLSCVGGHTKAPAKPHKSGVYDSDGVSYQLCAWGSCISCSTGGIHHGMRVVLRARIWCAITWISPLAVVVLRLGDASLDFFRDPAYRPSWPCARPTRGLSRMSICGTTSSMPSYGRARTLKRRCGAVWTSMSNMGLESIHTFGFWCLTFRSGGRKYGSF